ncbi:SulP family inorganic anion transporter [Pseudonocardia kunmingensis]|uniref:carbonic anhydrase n=1 Tax=Pseudonocardia kunmingensis TaxID=630975 RepID=A0A543DXK7_9PSEU|nr:bifunctional SulP family inorganic anion transporter/carbonic anhydrase [Pseudonocardia kunmingensis]TQM14046.1 carbonic anhydrase [Pseudonocardia kunmingensis]
MTTSPPRPDQHSPPRRRDTVRADVLASLVVFLVAVPLSLGIALASGAPLMAGLIAAVVGGIVAGLLGGTPLQVSGPAAGLTVVVAEMVARFGWQVTCLITAGAGLLQILFGLVRIARFSQAIPPAVVHGMLAGIGVTIALSQLHVVLGGSPPTGAVAALVELPGALAGIAPGPALAGLATIALLLLWPRLPRRMRLVPGHLVAVTAVTALALPFTGIPRVDLPGGLLEAVTLPTLLPDVPWAAVLGGMLTIALVASVESLLSAVAVDRMHSGPRSNPDRELIGQGAANTLSGVLGGLPVTGVIVRSSTNVAAGARTRASAVLHGLWIALFGIVLVGVIELIPMAALGGLLVVVGVQLVKPSDIRGARAHGELLVYLGTVAGVLLLNLLEGVIIGLVLAGLVMLHRAARARVRIVEPDGAAPWRVVVEGSLSFLSVPALSRTLAGVPADVPVRLELVVDYLDHTAFDHLDAWTARRRASGGEVTVTEPGARDGLDGPTLHRYATWSQWQEVDHTPHAPLLAGVAAYHSDAAELVRPTLEGLAHGQAPKGLLLCCADSRVQPNLITRSGPGDLFTVQNVGNLVAGTSVHAALQYATEVLRVPLIAVCGHSGCGAMRGLLDGAPEPGDALGDWLSAGVSSLEALRAGHPVARHAFAAGYGEVEALAMVNVAVQLAVLRARDVDAALMGLYFDIPTARVLVLDEEAQEFRAAE